MTRKRRGTPRSSSRARAKIPNQILGMPPGARDCGIEFWPHAVFPDLPKLDIDIFLILRMEKIRISSGRPLPLQSGYADQGCFGGLSPEQFSVRRPSSDGASAGQVLVFGSGWNVRQALPGRRGQEHDRQTERAAYPLDTAPRSPE